MKQAPLNTSRTVRSIAVVTGATAGAELAYTAAVGVLAAELAARGIRIVYGGGYHRQSLLPLGADLAVECDVLVPAARQDVIDAQKAREVTAKPVVEGANLPASQKALEILAARKILVVTDFVANAGGIVAAGVAMESRYSPSAPTLMAFAR